MDLFDLANCVRRREPVDEIATFLCRPVREIRDKIAELDGSGELQRRVAEAAIDARDQVPAPPVGPFRLPE
jgi:hypothetical protein